MTSLDAISAFLVLIGALPLLLTALFAFEVSVAALRRPGSPATFDSTTEAHGPGPSLVVLVPAHNEERIIGATLAGLAQSLPAGARLLVVADNCSDATAAVARAGGAEVVERQNPDKRGKGFALEFGLQELEKAPPDVIVIVDADCRAEPGALDLISRKAAASGRPVQANYEMRLPDSENASDRRLRVAAFAWRVKNYLRPLGLHRLGLPCGLTGAGMALPFGLARKVCIGTDEIVEDLVLGLEFAREGSPPMFAPDACVHSTFPTNRDGQASQRTRWEAGHIQAIFRRLPGHVSAGIAQRNTALLMMCADTAVPPLVLLAFVLTAFAATSFLAWLWLGIIAPLIVAGLGLGLLCAGLLVAWHSVGRDLIAAADLRHVPGYVLSKPSTYFRALLGRKLEWVRTRRD